MKNLPDKIYVTPNFDRRWQTIAIDDESVEFVCKEAFIEKVCGWIKNNITNNPNGNSVLVRNGCVTLGMLVDDFKKYMKE